NVNRLAGVYTRYKEYGDCVRRTIGDKDLLSVSALGQGGWKCAGKFLVLQRRIEHRDQTTTGRRSYSDSVRVSECDIKQGLIGIQQKRTGVRAGRSRT